MPTTITKTIKPSGGDYLTLAAWQADFGSCTKANYPSMAADGDLVGADLIAVAECYSMTDTAFVTIASWATSAANYIKIYTPLTERHSGVWNSSKYNLSTPLGYNPLTIEVGNVTVEGLQLCAICNSWIAGVDIAYQLSNITVDKCIIKGSIAAGNVTENWGIFTGGANVNVMNNVIYGFWDGTVDAQTNGAISTNYAPIYTYNNTISNCYVGFANANEAPHVVVKNLFYNCTYDIGTNAVNDSYCATTNTSSAGLTAAATGNRFSQTFSFNSAVGNDYHLLSSDAGAKGYGETNPGSGLYSDDIVGTTRSVPWDIGAFVYTSSGSTYDTPYITVGNTWHPVINAYKISGGAWEQAQTAQITIGHAWV